MNDAPRVVPASGLIGRLLAGPSPVETAERAAIDACWARALAARPKIFNGRVLLGETVEIRDGVLHVAFREAAFATLVWLRTLPPDDRRLLNVFGAAAVVTPDGAALLGRMALQTANAGQVYFPAGTPDRGDVTGDEVDVEGSIVRELGEETGLARPLVRATPRAFAVFHGRIAAYVRRFDTDLNSIELRERVRASLREEAEPELDEVVLARSVADLPAETAAYARAVLPHLLG